MIIANDEQEGIQKELFIAYVECVQQLMKSKTQLFSSFSTLYHYIIKQERQNIILGPKIAAFLCRESVQKTHHLYSLKSVLLNNCAYP
jgi:hypothetical protein